MPTLAEYQQLVNTHINEQVVLIAAMGPLSAYNLTANSFVISAPDTVIDSTYFLESDDDWGTPIAFGWVALDAHFSGSNSQGYYLDNIIEVRYD